MNLEITIRTIITEEEADIFTKGTLEDQVKFIENSLLVDRDSLQCAGWKMDGIINNRAMPSSESRSMVIINPKTSKKECPECLGEYSIDEQECPICKMITLPEVSILKMPYAI